MQSDKKIEVIRHIASIAYLSDRQISSLLKPHIWSKINVLSGDCLGFADVWSVSKISQYHEMLHAFKNFYEDTGRDPCFKCYVINSVLNFSQDLHYVYLLGCSLVYSVVL